MQPIHFAAMNNQPRIVTALVEEYGVNPMSKSEVSVCVFFPI